MILVYKGELTFRCKKCKGDKVVKDKKRVEFQIEPGTENGERIALKGEGDEIVSLTHLVLN
jgi:DnaJ-class molecular chaperone